MQVGVEGKTLSGFAPRGVFGRPPILLPPCPTCPACLSAPACPSCLPALTCAAAYRELVLHWLEERYTLRYSGGLVPDLHHILSKVRYSAFV
jgi:hypothetical protein